LFFSSSSCLPLSFFLPFCICSYKCFLSH
jgi:hypothetical protein